MKQHRHYIGLIGTNGAGKSAACDYLQSIGFLVVSLSDIVRAELHGHQKPETRDNLVHIANDMKAQFGMDVLARRAFHESTEKDVFKIAFDSIRNIDEVNYLRDRGVFFLGINAPIELRFERVVSRGRASDRVDFDTFKAHDIRENSGQSSGQNIGSALAVCDAIIQNTGNLDEFHAQLHTILENDLGLLRRDKS